MKRRLIFLWYRKVKSTFLTTENRTLRLSPKAIFLIVFLMSLNMSLNAEDTQAPSAPEDTAGTQEDNAKVRALEFAEKGTETVSNIEERRISLNLRNIDIIEALKFFAMKTGINIVPTHKVSGRVTLTVENAPAKDVFDIMLRSNALAYDKRGQIYNVMTEDEYRKIYGRLFADLREVKVFRLKYAIPEQAFNILDTIKSSIGRLLVDPESGTILLMDTPENINDAQNTLLALEQETTVKVFNLKYAKAKDVEEQLKAQLDVKKVGTIKSDERTNQVIVQTLPERMKNIEQLIVSLDKKTKGVLIDVKIIKITLNNARTRGIEWEGLFKAASDLGMTYMGSYPFSVMQSATAAWQSRESFFLGNMTEGIGAYPFSGTSSGTGASKVLPGERIHVGIIDANRDFDLLIQYLQTFGKTKILSNPTIAAVNNREAKIHVGERRAYVTTTVTTGASTSTTSEEVTYVETGIRLSIVPLINDDGYVTMTIKPEISSVIGNVPTSSKNLIPIIDTSVAETTVIAKDGSTIVLGGLGREEKTESTREVPFFSRIPLLGNLFRSTTHSVNQMELLILITPIIFEGDKLITAKDKENELNPVKPVKSFDVFKPEVPEGEVPVSSTMPKDLISPKFFKPYHTSKMDTESDTDAAMNAGYANLFEPKGIKSYNTQDLKKDTEPQELALDNQAQLKGREADLVSAPPPKEYRAYY